MIITDITDDLQSHWLGMQDFTVNLKLSGITISLSYVGEPPFGDSYHSLSIDGLPVSGYIWGCNFIFPDQQQFMVCSWMEQLYERKTVIIELSTLKLFVTDRYWYDYKVEGEFLVLGNDDFKTQKLIKIDELHSYF